MNRNGALAGIRDKGVGGGGSGIDGVPGELGNSSSRWEVSGIMTLVRSGDEGRGVVGWGRRVNEGDE